MGNEAEGAALGVKRKIKQVDPKQLRVDRWVHPYLKQAPLAPRLSCNLPLTSCGLYQLSSKSQFSGLENGVKTANPLSFPPSQGCHKD